MFLLVDEGTVRKYKADLTDEIEPQIRELLSRAEKGLRLLVKRENMLRTRVRFDVVLIALISCAYSLFRLRHSKHNKQNQHPVQRSTRLG